MEEGSVTLGTQHPLLLRAWSAPGQFEPFSSPSKSEQQTFRQSRQACLTSDLTSSLTVLKCISASERDWLRCRSEKLELADAFKEMIERSVAWWHSRKHMDQVLDRIAWVGIFKVYFALVGVA